jgi:hypothetical protein
MSFATLFVLAIAAFRFHLNPIETIVLFAGYLGFAWLDKWYRRRQRQKIVEYELFGWKADNEDGDFENKGEMSRRRLTGQDKVNVSRCLKNFLGITPSVQFEISVIDRVLSLKSNYGAADQGPVRAVRRLVCATRSVRLCT